MSSGAGCFPPFIEKAGKCGCGEPQHLISALIRAISRSLLQHLHLSTHRRLALYTGPERSRAAREGRGRKRLAFMSLVRDTVSMSQYEVIAFETEPGKAPFQDWYDSIKDSRAKTIVLARIGRAAEGNFGDWKTITGATGLCEMRIPYGQGFRVYYTVVGQKIVLLLAGSTKQGQDKAIAKAKEYLAEANRRVK